MRSPSPTWSTSRRAFFLVPGTGTVYIDAKLYHARPGVVVKAHRQRAAQLAATRLVEDTAAQTGPEHCSSASLIVPFRPSSSRSLKCAGS